MNYLSHRLGNKSSSFFIPRISFQLHSLISVPQRTAPPCLSVSRHEALRCLEWPSPFFWWNITLGSNVLFPVSNHGSCFKYTVLFTSHWIGIYMSVCTTKFLRGQAPVVLISVTLVPNKYLFNSCIMNGYIYDLE